MKSIKKRLNLVFFYPALAETLSLPHRTVAAEVRKQIAGQYGSPQLLKNLNVGTAASNTVGYTPLYLSHEPIQHPTLQTCSFIITLIETV